jgi:putative FmdB family regulatory protein
LKIFAEYTMPIYAYRCEECGFSKDVLQKISDPVLTTCLSCGKPSFKKQLTAAGFQLKGTGWYVTDFRGGSTPPAGTANGTAPATSGTAPAASGTATSNSGSTAAASDSGAAAPAPAAAPSTDKSST